MIAKGYDYAKEAKKRGSDLILFPEMWTTGFAWSQLKQMRHSFDPIAHIAKTNNIWVGGSSPGPDKLTNSFTLFSPEGELKARYDKTHLFSLMRENEHIVAGDRLTLYDAPWGRTGFSICYDIRFPELFRSYALGGARIVFLPVAFPHPRKNHLMTLLKARAIENQMFVVMTNRVGKENLENGPTLDYCGSSCVIDPWGETVILGSESKEALLTTSINLKEVEKVRAKMETLKDRRPELY